ncbi:MAG: ROK family protein [Prevotellaceae bacterium]|jgi:predicted NBD/HSP70 family sugar kinase|nr:ROK family protein [Prevotellaceae bacterium]
MYSYDKRIVITLDAGGTNFVFSAIMGNEYIVEPITLPACADKLDTCMASLVKGFDLVIGQLKERPVAISFAFPGPADYPNGIIGGYLPNFPSFRDGVALKPFLEEKFGIPVFINNDGDLYTYGEALTGVLPEISEKLKKAGSTKQFKNLIGYTLGTGFGIGIVIDGRLNVGDNSCVETFCLKHKKYPDVLLEEGVSIRAVTRVYGEQSGNADHNLSPKEICEIAEGTREGNKNAALESFEELGEVAGDAIATTVTLIDGLVVIGGGLAGARKFFMPALLKEMRAQLKTLSGETLSRVQMKVYDLDDEKEFEAFAKGDFREINVYGSDRKVAYDPQKRIGVTTSKIGTSRAIALGAYAYALNKIDKK